MASPAWQQLPNAGQPQQGHWAQPPGTPNQVQGQSQGHGRGIYPGYPASPSQPYHRGNQLNSRPGGAFVSSSPNVSIHQASSISVQSSQAATSPSAQSAQSSGSSPQTGSNNSLTPGQPMQVTGSSMQHLPNILGQPGYPLRWQSPQLGFTARPDAPLLVTRPGLPTSSIAAQSMGAAPTLVQHPYQPYQTSGAPPSQWIHPTQCQSPQRPQFLYASNFSLPYQRQDGMHGTAQASFRPLGDPFPGGHPLGIWGSQVDAGGAGPKELPDFHASKMSTAVNSEEKSHIVSDSKSEKNFKFEVSEEDSWAAHKTEDGVIYYYNSVTGESTYEKPVNFKGEAGSVTSQLTPVSWEKLTGTEWLLVTTNDGKKYYYNPRSQATSWQVPVEIVEMAKKQADEPVSTAGSTISTPAALSGGREAKGTASNTPTALDTIKKKLQESSGSGIGSAVVNSPISDPDPAKTMTSEDAAKDKSKETDVSTSDSSSDSEEEGPTKEDRILQFKEMLKEKGVAPFSKWEKELPKFIFDPRFKAIPSHDERRSTFEHYVRTRAEEERKEKRAAQKASIEGFKQLLEEATKDISHNTTYESIARVWGRDPRFEALDRKDREMLLNERVLPLRKAEEERYKSIHAAAAAEFQAMLKERGDINTTSRWSKVKDLLRNDSRYKGVKRGDREGIFNAYVAELRAAEQEAEKAAKAKREEENKLREKERETRKRKEREEQELERVRAKARRKDAVTAYQALLTEKIKDPEASWTESRPKLEKDPLGRATNPELDLADRERLFRDHVKELYERCEKEYRALLADVLTPDAASRHLEDECLGGHGKPGGRDMPRMCSGGLKQKNMTQRISKLPHLRNDIYSLRVPGIEVVSCTLVDPSYFNLSIVLSFEYRGSELIFDNNASEATVRN